MTRKRVIIALLALILLLTAVVLYASRQSEDDKVPTYAVREARFERRVTAEGHFEAENSTPVGSPVEAEGAIKIAWMAEDQSLVKKGDVLIQFDPSDFEKNLDVGTSDRETAQNRIARLDAEALATGRNLQRDAGQAEVELESARSFQSKDPTIFSHYEVVESGIEEELAVERREYALRVQKIRAEVASADRDLQMIEQRKADLKIGQAARGMKALAVTAPHDGIIVFKRDWRGDLPRVGATVWAGSPLGEIPTMEKMRAQLFVLEADAGGIEIGQKATVRADADPTVVFQGKVEQIDKIAKPRIRGNPVQYFGVRLSLERTDAQRMKPGSRLRATIALASNEKAITVPRQAIFEKGGAKIVYVRTPDGFRPRPVTLGVLSAGKVLITRGLASGDVIALKDPSANSSDEEKDAA